MSPRPAPSPAPTPSRPPTPAPRPVGPAPNPSPSGPRIPAVAAALALIASGMAGRIAVVVAIVAGAALSFSVASPALALASAAAFGLSELADFAVYEPLHRRRWLVAVAASNVVGLVVDSALFLWLAFGSLAYLPGQIVGKAWMTALAVALLAGGRWVHRRRAA